MGESEHNSSPASYTLPGPNGVVRIGRDAANDIVLPQKGVSRFHSAIIAQEGGWYVQDRNSYNGTWVNGVAVQNARLHDGDTIRVGTTEFEFDGHRLTCRTVQSRDRSPDRSRRQSGALTGVRFRYVDRRLPEHSGTLLNFTSAPRPRSALFQYLLVGAGMAALVGALLVAQSQPPTPAEFVLVAALAYWLREQELRISERITFHPGLPVVFSAVLLWEGWGVLPILGGGLAADMRRRAALPLAVLNAAADALRAGACALVWSLASAHSTLAQAGWWRDDAAFVAALAVFLGADWAVTVLYLRLNASTPASGFDPRLLLLDAGLAPIGLLGALIYRHWNAYCLVLLAVPAVTVLQMCRFAMSKVREKARVQRLLDEKRVLYDRVVAGARQAAHMQQQLLQARKMAALGELAGGVAHEINNPLAAIQVSLDLIPAGQDTRNLQRIREAVERCRSIVGKLLEFGREAPSPRREMTLESIVQSALKLLEVRLDGMEVEVTHQPPPTVVMVDPDEMAQVVANLVGNARDALENRAGGRICIRTGREDLYACIEVSDNGPGMPPEVRERIFEPFFTTKDVGKGSGLGLYLSYRIVSRHQGEIHVESTPGAGSCFRVRLPLDAPV